jgi:hypothetical protein
VLIATILCIANLPPLPAEAAKPGTVTIRVKNLIEDSGGHGGHGGLRGANVTVYITSDLQQGPWVLLGSAITAGGGSVRISGSDAYPNGYVRFTVSYMDYGEYLYPPLEGYSLNSRGSATIIVPYPPILV